MKLPEIREVEDPASPAVAWTENGRTVVEVDKALKGKERSKAIMSAVRLHEEGLAALLLLPLMLSVWGPLKHWAQEHTAAAALTGAGLVAGLTLIVAPAVLDREDRPRIGGPPIASTARSHLSVPAPTTTPTVPKSTTTTRPTGLPTVAEVRPGQTRRVEPTATHPTATRPSTRRSPTPSPTVEPTPVPSTSSPDRTPTPPPTSVAAAASPPAADPVADEPSGPTAEPIVAVAHSCLLQVDLDPLANIGVLC